LAAIVNIEFSQFTLYMQKSLEIYHTYLIIFSASGDFVPQTLAL